MNGILIRQARRLRIALGLAALVLAGACGSSTDPGGGGQDIEVAYSPTVANLTHRVGQSRDFSVYVTGTDQVQADWTVDGAAAGSGTVFHYVAGAVGVDTVAVTVQAADSTAGRSWYVTVEPETSLLPAPVTSLSLADGPAPGEVVATWVGSQPTAYPLQDYLVGCSFTGPLDNNNWDAATLLGAYAHEPGRTEPYTQTYGVAEGMVPGATVWFAVRARDDRGQLSSVVGVVSRSVTYAWNLHVQVQDDTGAPLQSVILDHGGEKVYTDADGRATIGPLRNVDTVDDLRTASTLFDYTCPSLSVTTDTLRIVLVHKYVMDHVPCTIGDYPDYLAYLRGATQTASASTGTVLHKWDHYPLSVYVPPGLSPTEGWDMQALIRDALPIWNDSVAPLVPGDGDYLVETPDSTTADILITPTDMPSNLNGFTRVIDPGGPIGDFVPQRMRITIERDLDSLGLNILPDRYTEVAIHELGHALGHYGHTCSNSVGNLMDAGGAIGSLAGGPANAINQDERHAVIAVRHLPEGVDMARYEMP